MNYRKTNYTVISKKISQYNTGKNKNTDIYVYACIALNSDFKTKMSRIREIKISEFSGIAVDTVNNSVPRLKQNIYLFERLDQKPLGKGKMGNVYYFEKNPENYFFLDNRFFYLELDVKLKGFLLLLKSICKNNTNKYISAKPIKGKCNISELAEKLHQDRKIVKSLIDKCIEFGQIREIPKGLIILNDCFLLNLGNTTYDRVYNHIYKFCVDKGSIPPERNDEKLRSGRKRNLLISRMLSRFSVPDEKLYEILRGNSKNRNEFFNYHHLPTVLESRCKNLPEQPTLEYFLKVLDMENPTKCNKPELMQIIL